MSSDVPLLEAQDLTCVRGERLLFKNLAFTLSRGEVIHVCGANGVGKTSLLRLLTGLTHPCSGKVLSLGRTINEDSVQYRERLLYLSHFQGVHAHLTPEENLTLYRHLHATKSTVSLHYALEQVGLYGYEDVLCHTLSAGQKRRVALARLIMSDAPLWLLDEPLTSLDQEGVDGLHDCFNAHLKSGGAIVFTSHQVFSTTKFQIKSINLGDWCS